MGTHFKSALHDIVNYLQKYAVERLLKADELLAQSLNNFNADADLREYIRSFYSAKTPFNQQIKDKETPSFADHLGPDHWDSAIKKMTNTCYALQEIAAFLDETTKGLGSAVEKLKHGPSEAQF